MSALEMGRTLFLIKEVGWGGVVGKGHLSSLQLADSGTNPSIVPAHVRDTMQPGTLAAWWRCMRQGPGDS